MLNISAYVHVCFFLRVFLCTKCCMVLVEVKRGQWLWSAVWVLESESRVLCKNNKISKPLSYFSNPYNCYLACYHYNGISGDSQEECTCLVHWFKNKTSPLFPTPPATHFHQNSVYSCGKLRHVTNSEPFRSSLIHFE